MKALILAAGRGKRLGEQSEDHNKCMLKVSGKPLIQYSLENAVSARVDEIVIVVGYLAEDIINAFGNRLQNTRIKYVLQLEQKGLVHAIECSARTIGNSDFMLFLADEILYRPRHKEMIDYFYSENLFAICGIVIREDRSQIGKTYAVIQDESDHRIYRLIEKPRKPFNNVMGTGNCIFKPEIFEYIEHTPINQTRGEKELPDLIQCAVDDGHIVKSFDIGQGYVNINTPEDIVGAENVRRMMI